MEKQILQINFEFNGTKEEFETGFMPAAQPIADQPGLLWEKTRSIFADDRNGFRSRIPIQTDIAFRRDMLKTPPYVSRKSS